MLAHIIRPPVVGFLSYKMIMAKADATVIVGLASTALGALIGLLAPSPAQG